MPAVSVAEVDPADPRHTAAAALADESLYAQRRRHGRPGPKSLRDRILALRPPAAALDNRP